ncbi:hypothetical protein L227DRAFT_355813 [Lentinus tigrinus ALCF2SS1-6]|uniref:Uncharacterized protein n=1 Tax=Lentinus tigrinus ALCF2SS1-6 TaxID=1328759 RepID=A0A5C2RSI2_9APHY|nr:hypothetical protein L227DRAFT_355813 [Lentinus tigrinus ALCF2SS1-6]
MGGKDGTIFAAPYSCFNHHFNPPYTPARRSIALLPFLSASAVRGSPLLALNASHMEPQNPRAAGAQRRPSSIPPTMPSSAGASRHTALSWTSATGLSSCVTCPPVVRAKVPTSVYRTATVTG